MNEQQRRGKSKIQRNSRDKRAQEEGCVSGAEGWTCEDTPDAADPRIIIQRLLTRHIPLPTPTPHRRSQKTAFLLTK
ncbi:hypothetical protein MUG91_G45n117 [Manis pentadactyla]|nr:hypothetical protein MUG91_G45n117 [Manis pentadactyla]